MRTLFGLLLFFFISLDAVGQEAAPTIPVKKIENIEKLVKKINENKKLSKQSPNGNDPTRGAFKFTYYYFPKKEVQKIQYQFLSDTSNLKTLFYDNNELIKVEDSGLSYYYVDGLFYNSTGMRVDSAELKDILKFQEGLKHDILNFMLK